MATTRIMPLHTGKGRTESQAVSDIIDYVGPQGSHIATFSPLSQAQRERHIKLLVKRYTQRPGLCSMLDLIHSLKTGEVKTRWT